ncbi:TetR/AcrR family transcriptional regulator [Thermodesulfobacteriota bacterium]
MPKIVDKEEKARAISDAALSVFRERGYHGTRMMDIARSAGIGKGTVYEYFKNKADILHFSFDRYFGIFTNGVFDAMKDKTRPSEKLYSLVDFALQHAVEWEDHCAIYVDYYGAARTDKDGRFSLSAIYEQMKRIIMDLVDEGQAAGEIDSDFDPSVVAELLVSVFDGIILHRIFEGQGTDREALKKATLRLVQNGLLTRIVDPGEAKQHS